MRTPWSAVTIIAVYADPGRVLSLIIIPALAHGTRPGRVPDPVPVVDGIRPVSEVTWAVMLPFQTLEQIDAAIPRVAGHLGADGLLGYPTETVYGLGSFASVPANHHNPAGSAYESHINTQPAR